MANIAETGNPSLTAVINDGSTGGSFFVYDDDASSNVFEVKDTGAVVHSHGWGYRNGRQSGENLLPLPRMRGVMSIVLRSCLP